MVALPSLRTVARGSSVLAGIAGAYGGLRLLGAFGPVGCWTARTTRGDGTVTTTRGCEAGVDFLLGSTGGNAPVLFFWGVVLLALTTTGVAAVWTGHRRLAWGLAGVGAFVSVLGILSIGWLFVLPTVFLLVAAAALTVAARGTDGGTSGATV